MDVRHALAFSSSQSSSSTSLPQKLSRSIYCQTSCSVAGNLRPPMLSLSPPQLPLYLLLPPLYLVLLLPLPLSNTNLTKEQLSLHALWRLEDKCLASVTSKRDARSIGCIWSHLCLYLLKCIPWSCVTRSRFNNKVASMCSSKELLCARVVCDCARHHVHAINDTRATDSLRFFKELHVPGVSEMVHSSPRQPLQFGKSRLAGSSCRILRVTVSVEDRVYISFCHCVEQRLAAFDHGGQLASQPRRASGQTRKRKPSPQRDR